MFWSPCSLIDILVFFFPLHILYYATSLDLSTLLDSGGMKELSM
jgi:hypothetical protein